MINEKSNQINYWTFKHKPGGNSSVESIRRIIESSVKLNCALMQYEYPFQKKNITTMQWKAIQKIKEGDIIFLRGDKKIFAVGKAIRPRKSKDVLQNLEKIVKAKDHGIYISGKYKGCVHFEDAEVFYEDLNGEEQNWGQRIDVDNWMHYTNEGIDIDEGVNIPSSSYLVVRQIENSLAQALYNKLENIFMKNFAEYIDPLVANKNLILTGAPGTGKTYLAKQLAMVMLFKKDKEELLSDDEKKQFEQQCAFVQFHPSYDYTDFIEGLRPKKEPGQKEIGFELKDGIFMEFCKRARKDETKDEKKDEKKYIFIIDEINRAEISKVFGELFFSIDPGYRGEKGKVKTQYANLREENDQYFYVPKNVYIIGTMNDIDRSVESFDFAMRRRFVWEEISAEESAENMNLDVETKSRMAKLNEAIENIESLNSSYHIGAAYFLKLKNYDNDYDKLWELHLKPLVQEYLRGLPDDDAKKHFVDIKNSFLPDKK